MLQHDDLVRSLPGFQSVGNPLAAEAQCKVVIQVYGNLTFVRGAQRMLMAASRDQNVEGGECPAVRLLYNADLKALLLIPQRERGQGQQDSYPVTWHKASVMVGIGKALKHLQWTPSKGQVRDVIMTMHRNLPAIGTALLMHLGESELRPVILKGPRRAKNA